MSHHRRAGKGDRTPQFRDHEAVLRVRLRACLVPVVTAKNLLNLMQRLMALVARLPLPEKHKALSAYATLNLGVPARALTKNLHFKPLFSPGSFNPTRTKVAPAGGAEHSPVAVKGRSFWGKEHPQFGSPNRLPQFDAERTKETRCGRKSCAAPPVRESRVFAPPKARSHRKASIAHPNPDAAPMRCVGP
jgi:hypothetical protein